MLYVCHHRGADIAALVREASVFALKAAIVAPGAQADDVITVTAEHFEKAFQKIKPSVSVKVCFSIYAVFYCYKVISQLSVNDSFFLGIAADGSSSGLWVACSKCIFLSH